MLCSSQTYKTSMEDAVDYSLSVLAAAGTGTTIELTRVIHQQ